MKGLVEQFVIKCLHTAADRGQIGIKRYLLRYST